MFIANNNHKATEEEIIALEKKYGFHFPADYKQFLKEVNGGEEDAKYFFQEDIKDEIPVQALMGTNHPDKGFDLDTVTQRSLEQLEEPPEKTIVIGADMFGGRLIMREYEKSGELEILFWDMTMDYPQSTEENATYHVADSFTEFLNMLQIEKE